MVSVHSIIADVPVPIDGDPHTAFPHSHTPSVYSESLRLAKAYSPVRSPHQPGSALRGSSSTGERIPQESERDYDASDSENDMDAARMDPNRATVEPSSHESTQKIVSPSSRPQMSLSERTWERLSRPTVYQQKPSSGTYIPQRTYSQGTPIPGCWAGQRITFATVDEVSFQAKLALAGQFDRLMEGNSPVFAAASHTITLRIEVSDLFVIPKATANTISASIVAGVQRMVRAGEYHAS
jgi:hypothetical protein